MSDVSATSCWPKMPLLVDFNFNKIDDEAHRNPIFSLVDSYRITITTQLVVYILFALSAVLSVFAFNGLFDLNSSFSGQMGGIACGLTLPFLGLAAYYSSLAHHVSVKHKIITALIAIAALAVIIGGAASGMFSSEWKGLILGGAVGTIAAKLTYDRHFKINTETGIFRIKQESRTELLIETAKKTALFVFIMGLMIAALYANAKMFGSNPDFAGQWKGMIAGGTVALLGAGLYQLAKLYYEGQTISNLTENPSHRLMFALATIALVCFIILHGTGAFDLRDAFHQCPGLITAGLLTLPALKLMHFKRDLTRIIEARQLEADAEAARAGPHIPARNP